MSGSEWLKTGTFLNESVDLSRLATIQINDGAKYTVVHFAWWIFRKQSAFVLNWRFYGKSREKALSLSAVLQQMSRQYIDSIGTFAYLKDV